MQADLLRDLHPDETLSRLERVWPYPEIDPAPPRPVLVRKVLRSAEDNRAKVLSVLTLDWKRTRSIARAAKMNHDTAADALNILVERRLAERVDHAGGFRGKAMASYRRRA